MTTISQTKLQPGTATQFCYVAFDMDRAMTQWIETVKAGPFFQWELSDASASPRRYRGKAAEDTFKACYAFIGTSMIEIMQPTNNAPSMLREILDTKGEVVQHIFPRIRPLKAGEFDAISKSYIDAGCERVMDSTAPFYGRIAFFDAVHRIGAFIELIELLPPSYKLIEAMYEAHLAWDGTRPIRPLSEVMDQIS